MARRTLRLIQYQQRSPLNERDYLTRRKTLMYLQQIGMFEAARLEGQYFGPWESAASDTFWRHGELAERIAGDEVMVGRMAARAGVAISDPARIEWHTLVVVLSEGVVNGLPQQMHHQQVQRVYDNFLLLEQVVCGLTGWSIEFHSDYLYIENEQSQSFVTRDGVFMPADDLFAVRGSYDSVIVVRPGGSNVTVGPDMGPNGAAYSDLDSEVDALAMLKAWCRQFNWLIYAGERGAPLPVDDDVSDCGVRPVPSPGFALRSALRYLVAPEQWRHGVMTAPAMPQDNLRLWKVRGPIRLESDKLDRRQSVRAIYEQAIQHHEAESGVELRFDSATPFVNLRDLDGFEAGGAQLAMASCWVYSPEYQDAILWLGHSDGAAVWLNGECIHNGVYYASGRWRESPSTEMVNMQVTLTPGWSKLELVVAADGEAMGYSVRFADRYNRSLIGLASCLNDPDEADLAVTLDRPTAKVADGYYDWSIASDDFYNLLPEVTLADLAKQMGSGELQIYADIDGDSGVVQIGPKEAVEATDGRMLPRPKRWQAFDARHAAGSDADYTLNNRLDWAREDVAALHYKHDGIDRALLFVRPEAMRPYLELLAESPDALRTFGNRPPWQRVLGYLPLRNDSNRMRPLFVIDVAIGAPGGWPLDAADLLAMPMPMAVAAPNAPVAPVVPAAPATDDGGN